MINRCKIFRIIIGSWGAGTWILAWREWSIGSNQGWWWTGHTNIGISHCGTSMAGRMAEFKLGADRCAFCVAQRTVGNTHLGGGISKIWTTIINTCIWTDLLKIRIGSTDITGTNWVTSLVINYYVLNKLSASVFCLDTELNLEGESIPCIVSPPLDNGLCAGRYGLGVCDDSRWAC